MRLLGIVLVLLCVVLDPTESITIKAPRQCDIAKSMRRLIDNRNILLVVTTLVKQNESDGAMNFGQLLQETDLKSNDLNHALLEMKNIGLVVQDEDKNYSLTQFCVTLLKAWSQIREDIKANQNIMVLPAKPEDLRSKT